MSQGSAVFELVEAVSTDEVATVRALICEYARWINVDLCFQEIDAEIDGLPGKYAAERGGVLLLARLGAEPAGCVALRALEPGVCEMKRLWVREAFRGSGLGGRLVRTVLERAAALGYERIRLDTLSHMDRAQRLYAQLGFREIPPYYDNPLAGTRYLEKPLNARPAADRAKRP